MSKPWIAIWTASKYNAQILAAAFAVRIAGRAGIIYLHLIKLKYFLIKKKN